jgi:outer membrane protein OmpA-like peptidoglycan-associated protein
MAGDMPHRDRRAYRRGLVLGLTIGELFMLIAFLLVLAIAWSEIQQRAAMARVDELSETAQQVGGVEALDRLLAEAEHAKQEVADLQAQLEALQPLRTLAAEVPPEDLDDAIELVRGVRAQPALKGQTADTLAAMPAEIARLQQALVAAGAPPAETGNATVEAVRDITAAYLTSNAEIGRSLGAAFGGDLADWNASFDAAGLVFRFEDPDALFEQGEARLRPRFRAILDDFCPRFLTILNGYADQIAEIRIEGHTSSEWRSGTGDRDAYFANMQLSQGRTRAVLEYCLTLPAVAPLESWARADTVAVGMSSSHPIQDPDGSEDARLSRRVEFRVVTDAASRISEIASEVAGAQPPA